MGKTDTNTVLIRYCHDLFDQQDSTATIGVDFKVKRNSSKRGLSHHSEHARLKRYAGEKAVGPREGIQTQPPGHGRTRHWHPKPLTVPGTDD